MVIVAKLAGWSPFPLPGHTARGHSLNFFAPHQGCVASSCHRKVGGGDVPLQAEALRHACASTKAALSLSKVTVETTRWKDSEYPSYT
jgi:hypothetical protein